MQNIFRLEEIIQSKGHFIRLVYFTGFQAGYQLFRRQVDIHHFIRFFQHTVGNAFLYLDTGNTLHFFINALDMLYVDSRYNIDTLIQQVHYILPTLLIPTAFYIGMRQLVHNNDFRMDTDDSVKVHFLEFLTLIEYLTPGNYGQSRQHRLRTGTSMRFHIAYIHVYPIVQQVMDFLKHTISFAYTGNHADVDLKLTTT